MNDKMELTLIVLLALVLISTVSFFAGGMASNPSDAAPSPSQSSGVEPMPTNAGSGNVMPQPTNRPRPTEIPTTSCAYCGGTGTCSHCFWGECDNCNGEGQIDCDSCFGGGSCQHCYGMGGELRYVVGGDNKWYDCRYCDGSGDCNRCDGRGGRECGYCNGSGNCGYCLGSGDCKYCGGRGSY